MFIFLVLPILGLTYVLWHIWQILPFPDMWRWAVIVISVALFLSMFLGFSGAIEKMPLNLASVVYEIGNSTIFVLLYLVMIFLALDIARAVHIIPKEWLFNNGYSSLGVFIAMLLIFSYGNIHYYNKERVAINVKTDQVKPMKIVMLSDLHLGYHNRRSEFKKWVDRINAEQPDLILIGGDIIDISLRPLLAEHVAEEFRRLHAPIYACLGNHEYYSGRQKALLFYKEAGIELLRDSVAKIGNLVVIGRDDRTNSQRKTLAKIINEAKQKGIITENSDKKTNEFTILLDHQPYHLEEAEQMGINFQFSGHTHYGQVWPASWVTRALYEDAFGPLKKGDTQYYVSSGMGIWGGKFRIGTRSEYVVLTINK